MGAADDRFRSGARTLLFEGSIKYEGTSWRQLSQQVQGIRERVSCSLIKYKAFCLARSVSTSMMALLRFHSPMWHEPEWSGLRRGS